MKSLIICGHFSNNKCFRLFGLKNVAIIYDWKMIAYEHGAFNYTNCHLSPYLFYHLDTTYVNLLLLNNYKFYNNMEAFFKHYMPPSLMAWYKAIAFISEKMLAYEHGHLNFVLNHLQMWLWILVFLNSRLFHLIVNVNKVSPSQNVCCKHVSVVLLLFI